MSSCSCACTCGKLLFKGQLIPQCLHHSTMKKGVIIRKSFYSIESLIEIENDKCSKLCSHDLSLTKMKCMTCGTTFRVLSYESKLFLEKAQQLNISNQRLPQFQGKCQLQNLHKNNNISVIPLYKVTKPLNNLQDEQSALQSEQLNQQTCEKCNDTDFELMFSNEYDPYVGSYKYHIEDFSNGEF